MTLHPKETPFLLCLAFALAACPGKDTGTADIDGDGYPVGEDCDDSIAWINPGAAEICNGLDDDCDDLTDDGDDSLQADAWYADLDSDGYGGDLVTAASCTQPSGAVNVPGDCDDAQADTNPGAPEVCDDRDDDCDGLSDSDDADISAVPEWFVDADTDGYGSTSTFACIQPEGTSTESGDCDDTDPSVFPGAVEHCDEIDNDCNGVVDDSAIEAGSWYTDADGDGLGDPNTVLTGCVEPDDVVSNSQDCDDSDASVGEGIRFLAPTETQMELHYAWGSSGYSTGTWILMPDGSFSTAGEGESGNWTFDCGTNVIDLLYDVGTEYIGDTTDRVTFEGTMVSFLGDTGTWWSTLE